VAWSYGGDPSASDKDAVRFEIQDTNSSSPLLQDAEIDWCILAENGVAAGTPTTLSGATLYGPAAKCMEALAAQFLAQADTQIGQMKITSTKRAAQYLARAKELRLKAQGYYSPYAGGQSIAEKEYFQSDSDAVQPAETRTAFDNRWAWGSQQGFSSEDFGPPTQ
jgi:hypothetical protein